jgi:cold-inducible RNA-binding protein
MSKKLFVGNLPFQTTEEELQDTFSRAGTVVSVAIPVDRVTGRKRGFGFVEMESEAAADAAIKDFHGQTLGGRQIIVNISRSKTADPA